MQNKLFSALRRIIALLDKHHVQYHITGGFSAHLYGATREINDLDIDIPEDDFSKIYHEVKDFIVQGPEDYTDGRWDLRLMTLNYFGQEIDISGAYKQKIFDDTSQQRIATPVNFSTSRKVPFHDIELTVIDPTALISYKQLLSGNHQKSDIQAVQEFIENTKKDSDLP